MTKMVVLWLFHTWEGEGMEIEVWGSNLIYFFNLHTPDHELRKFHKDIYKIDDDMHV